MSKILVKTLLRCNLNVLCVAANLKTPHSSQYILCCVLVFLMLTSHCEQQPQTEAQRCNYHGYVTVALHEDNARLKQEKANGVKEQHSLFKRSH